MAACEVDNADNAANDSYSSDSEWSILDCIEIFLNDRTEEKGTLYGNIDGVDSFIGFVNKLRLQGLNIEESPEIPGSSIVNDPYLEIERNIDLINGKFSFDWSATAGIENAHYGSPFYISNEKTLLCKYDSETCSPQKKKRLQNCLIKLTVKVVKLFVNYKIPRKDAKIGEKRTMIRLVKDALQSSEPPIPLIRYIVGVPNFKYLQSEGKGNVKKKSVKRKETSSPRARKYKKAETDENRSIETSSTKKTKSPKKQENYLQCQWSDSAEIMIPSALSTQNNPMLDVRNSPKQCSSQASPSKCVRTSFQYNEPSLLNGDTACNNSSMGQSQSIMQSASSIVNDLTFMLTQEIGNDIEIDPTPNIELHTVANLDLHTGLSVELRSEPNLLTPMHVPTFNLPLPISPSLNLDLSPPLSFSSSPVISPQNDKRKKSQDKTEFKHKEVVQEPELKPNKSMEKLKDKPKKSKKKTDSKCSSKHGQISPQSTPSNSSEKCDITSKSRKLKKKDSNKPPFAFNLEEVAKAQAEFRLKLKIMYDVSYKCGDVPCLKEIGLHLKQITVKLQSCLEPKV